MCVRMVAECEKVNILEAFRFNKSRIPRSEKYRCEYLGLNRDASRGVIRLIRLIRLIRKYENHVHIKYSITTE